MDQSLGQQGTNSVLAAGAGAGARGRVGHGCVLLQLAVRWPAGYPEDDGLAAARQLLGGSCQVAGGAGGVQGDAAEGGDVGTVQLVAVTRLGREQQPVICLTANPGGGEGLVQLADGSLWRYLPAPLSPEGGGGGCGGSARLLPLGPAACFPVPCPHMMAAPPLLDQASWPCPLTQPAPCPCPAAASPRPECCWPAVLGRHPAGCGGDLLLPALPGAWWAQQQHSRSPTASTKAGRTHSLTAGGFVHQERTEAGAGGTVAQRRMTVEQDGLKAAMQAAMRPLAESAAARDVSVRAVEAGARLVAAPSGGTQLVMQLPRGNLEAVCPRPLVLAAVASALDTLDFAAAWALATAQRLDLNLLVDWAWPSFLAAAPTFVAAVPSPSDLNDLLFALRPDSVCAPGGMYANIAGRGADRPRDGKRGASAGQVTRRPGHMLARWAHVGEGSAAGVDELTAHDATLPEGQSQGAALPPLPGQLPDAEIQRLLSQGGKVTAVCAAIRAAVLARMAHASSNGAPGVGADGVSRSLPGSSASAASAELLSVVVTSWARSQPPDLGQALSVIKQAKEQALVCGEGAGGGSGGPGPAERALRGLLLHVEPEAAYRAALALYDLPLAFMVITHAQRDPGEFLAELQRLSAPPDPHMRCAAIDLHLGRYPLALKHLVAAGQPAFPQ
ncbi:IKI3 family-domain-containing protein, partial [Haematococcus lacustris]